jgi:Asp-tRNA(Asn)/Glu-tRNA(Gln) amidotransferase A subunit family amidase
MDHPLHSDLSDPAALGIAQLAPALRSGALSSITLAEACLDRIERDEIALHSFITITADRVRCCACCHPRAYRRPHPPGRPGTTSPWNQPGVTG